MCFLAKKVEGEELDQLGQYLELRDTVDSIRAKERIYGHNWLSTGGEFTTRVRLLAHTLKGVCFKFIPGNIYQFAIFELVSQQFVSVEVCLLGTLRTALQNLLMLL